VRKVWAGARPAGRIGRGHLLMLWELQDEELEVEYGGLVSLRPLLDSTEQGDQVSGAEWTGSSQA
jgi:hypothetical protein